MSLKDPDDEYNELFPENAGKIGKIFNKNKKLLIILLIGIILGCALQYFVVNDFVASSIKNTCRTCFNSNEILNKENDCLYSLIPGEKNASQQCGEKLGTKENAVI
jgi:hypothetical protein